MIGSERLTNFVHIARGQGLVKATQSDPTLARDLNIGAAIMDPNSTLLDDAINEAFRSLDKAAEGAEYVSAAAMRAYLAERIATDGA